MATNISGVDGVDNIQSSIIEFNDYQLVSIEPIDLETEIKPIGNGQSYQNLTAQRALGVTYTNTSGRPILVNVTMSQNATNVNSSAIVGGITLISGGGQSNVAGHFMFTFIVPNNTTYSVSGSNPLVIWTELRT